MADRFDEQQNDQIIRDRMSFGGSAGAAQGFANGAMAGGAGREQRAQGLGQAMAQRQAYQNDFTQANQSRGGQQDAAGLMRSAAYGQQPSQAQLLGRNMIDQSLQAQMAGAASARGGALAQAAAMRNAANQAGAAQAQGMNQLSAMRAQEMAQARDAYFGSQAAMRGQDLQQQGMNMQSELAQRQLNQQGQLAYEQLGQNAQQFGDTQAFNAMSAQQAGMIHYQGNESAEYMKQKEINQHSEDRNTGVIGSAIAAAGPLIASFFSDINAKTDVAPIGAGGPQPLSQADQDYIAQEQARANGMRASDNAAHQDFMARKQIGAAFAAGFKQFGAGFGAPPIQFRAAGGPVAPGMPYVVGEKGPELIVPQQPGTVLPAPVTRNLAAQGAMSGPAPASFDKLGGGGMDVMGSLKAHSDFGTRFRSDPAGGMMMSDDRAKLAAAWDQGHAAAIADVEKLSRRSPEELKRLSEGDSYIPAAAAVRAAKAAAFDEGDASGRTAGYSRAINDQFEAAKAADDKRRGIRQPTSFVRDDPMAQANRAMQGSAYAYKPEFTPPEQAPGEKNVGPMAQNMAADPVASTAVKKDPNTGMLMLDGAKMTKLNSAGIASLQQQVDSLGAAIAKRKGAR